MEQDIEVSGNGNSYTTEFRQYDPRLGRWKSLDPLMGKYPGQSPYASFNNNPILFVDPDGLEGQDWVKGGTSANGEKTFNENTWHWEEDVNSKDQADKLGAVDWIGKDDSRTITATNGKRVTLSYNKEMDQPQVVWENTDETPVSDISPYLWAQSGVPDLSGPITKPWAGRNFMQGSDGSYDEFFDAYDSEGMVKIGDWSNNFVYGALGFTTGFGIWGASLRGGFLVNGLVNGTVNATGNGLSQYAAKEDPGDIDISSIGLSFLSGFIPGKSYIVAAGVGVADGLFDYSANKGFVRLGDGKSGWQFLNDAGCSALGNMGVASYGKFPIYAAPAVIFTTTAPTTVVNTVIDDKIK